MRATTLLVASVFLGSCTSRDPQPSRIAGGDVQRGRVAIGQYACRTCHLIPGITGANALVGPPLDGIATRSYLGGVLRNTPDQMIAWLRNPQRFAPLSAMPDLGVTEGDARDIAAYLYTLR